MALSGLSYADVWLRNYLLTHFPYREDMVCACLYVCMCCVQDMFQNAVEFLKLEKVEYAGIKGRKLSAQTVAIYEEFNDMYKAFQEVTYDPLDPQDTVSAVHYLAINMLKTTIVNLVLFSIVMAFMATPVFA